MDSIDLDVLKTCVGWLRDNVRCQLVTVIKTWGSSPRPPGAMLVLAADGRMVGSVSGGCIEDDLVAQVRAHGITRTLPEIVRYGINADDAHRFGLPCGGTIELVIEPLSALSRIAELLQSVMRRELVARHLNLTDSSVTLTPGLPDLGLQLTATTLTTLHGPRWRLLLIGAGQLSRFVAQVAAGMDYHVTVCDPRDEYHAGWDLPQTTLVRAMPDDLIIDMRPDCRSAIVALTHDPKLDDLTLIEALKSDAFYVGAIGSRASADKRRERLRLFDLNEVQLQRLHTPVGLYIGSKTPAEIAISILAEITAVKNRIALPSTVSMAS